MGINMSNAGKEYMIVLQLDNIQEFIISLFEKSDNKNSFSTVQHNSKIIAYMSDLAASKKDKIYHHISAEYKAYNYFEKIIEDVIPEKDEVVSVSGKLVVIVCDSQLSKIEQNIKKYYQDMLQIKIDLIYLKAEVINQNKGASYETLMDKLSSPYKYSEINKIIFTPKADVSGVQTEVIESTSNKKDPAWMTTTTQMSEHTTKKILGKYRENNRNQIMIVKADINNVGQYFKKLAIKKLKKQSKLFNQCIDNFKNEIETKKEHYFLLYAAGDDFFFIGKVTYIKQLIEEIFQFVQRLNDMCRTQEFTVGVGILTVDYRSPIRYYFARVDQLMAIAKTKAKAEEKAEKVHVICFNDQIILSDDTRWNIAHMRHLILHVKNSQFKSKLHNVLEILKQKTVDQNEQMLDRLDAIYLLTKDGQNTLTRQLAVKLLEHSYCNEQFIALLQNILLLMRYDNKQNEEIDNDREKLGEHLAKLKEQQFSSLKIIKIFERELTSLTYREQFWDQIAKGFWFSLNEYLADSSKLTIFLTNYQHNNKLLFGKYVDGKADISEKTGVQRREQACIKELIQDIETNKKRYEQFIRYRIICLNYKEE